MKLLSHLKLLDTPTGYKILDETINDTLSDQAGNDLFISMYKALLLAAKEADAIVRKGNLMKYGYEIIKTEDGRFLWSKGAFVSQPFNLENEAYSDAWASELHNVAKKLSVATDVLLSLPVIQQATFVYLTQNH